MLSEVQVTPTGFTTLPAYDSGWINIAKAEELTLYHNLGTLDLCVYLTGKSEGYGINQMGFGGTEGTYGLGWKYLTENTINVKRAKNDWFYEQVLV